VDVAGMESLPHERPVIGLVGQVCSGKSAVAEAFRRHGARVYDADKAVHSIYERPEVIREVEAMFGPEVLNAEGQVDRKALGRIVFDDRVELKRLTSEIIFPRTGVEMQKAIEDFRKSDAPALLLDAPSLFESGRHDVCDSIVYVAAPLERREKWAQKRSWAPGEIARRENMLVDDGEKRRRADAIIENDGTLEKLEQQVGRLMRLWTMQA
jgi:dephospho-CoA kinase